MIVRLTRPRVGTRSYFRAGQEITVSDAEGHRLIDTGAARHIAGDGERPVEAAMVTAPETATLPRPGARVVPGYRHGRQDTLVSPTGPGPRIVRKKARAGA